MYIASRETDIVSLRCCFDLLVGSLSCSRFGDPYPEACMSYVLTDPITEKEEGDLHPYNLSDSDTLVEISPLKDRGPFFSEQGSPVAWNPSTPFTSLVTSAFEDVCSMNVEYVSFLVFL